MNEYDFKPEVLPQDYVKEHGVMYDETVFYNWDDETTPLYDKDPKLGGKLFTGLLYEQYEDSGMIRWYEYYTDGFGNGAFASFYETGELQSYCMMKGYAFVGKLYQWHRNGKLKKFTEKDDRGRQIRTVHWDEAGTVTFLCENDQCIINKEY